MNHAEDNWNGYETEKTPAVDASYHTNKPAIGEEPSTPIIQALSTTISFLRTRDIATVTGLARRTIASHALAGTIPGAFKLGGVWLFDPFLIAKWIECCMRPQFRMS